VVGVTRFQGQLVTVLSLASLLGRAWATDPTNLLVLEARGSERDAAVAVDCTDVPRTVALPPDSLALSLAAPSGILPVRSVDGEVVQLIDVGRLIGREVVRGGR